MGGIPSSLGVAVSSLVSRLSFRLTVLSEGGGVDTEGGGVSSAAVGITSGEIWVSWVDGSWAVAVGGGVASATASGGGVATVGSVLRGAGLDTTASGRDREDFLTRRHCMMLVSFPPVEIRWLSLCRKLTLVT